MCNNFFLHNDKSSILFVNNHLDIQVNFFFLHNHESSNLFVNNHLDIQALLNDHL